MNAPNGITVRLNPEYVEAPYGFSLIDKDGRHIQVPYEPRYKSLEDAKKDIRIPTFAHYDDKNNLTHTSF